MADPIRDLLETYEEEGGALYWTPKQEAVLEAIKNNPDATRAEIAKIVGSKMDSCHQSYVTYVLENAEPGVIRELRRQIEELDPEEREAEAVPPKLEAFGGSQRTSADMGVEATGDDTTATLAGADALDAIAPMDGEGMVAADAEVQSIEFEGGEAVFSLVQEIPVRLTVKLPMDALQDELVQMLSGDEGDADTGEGDDETDETEPIPS